MNCEEERRGLSWGREQGARATEKQGHRPFPRPRGAHAKTSWLSSPPVEFPGELPSEPVPFIPILPVRGEARPPAASRRPPSHGSLAQRRHLLVSAGRQCPALQEGTRLGHSQTPERTHSHTVSHSLIKTTSEGETRAFDLLLPDICCQFG